MSETTIEWTERFGLLPLDAKHYTHNTTPIPVISSSAAPIATVGCFHCVCYGNLDKRNRVHHAAICPWETLVMAAHSDI